MRKNLQHERAHEKFFKWNLKWAALGGTAESYGWLASYLTDIVIDKIYYAKDGNYQIFQQSLQDPTFYTTKQLTG